METINGRKTYRMKAEDIKYADRLSDNQIADIPINNIYEWIRTGKWKKKDFETWLRVIRVIE